MLTIINTSLDCTLIKVKVVPKNTKVNLIITRVNKHFSEFHYWNTDENIYSYK